MGSTRQQPISLRSLGAEPNNRNREKRLVKLFTSSSVMGLLISEAVLAGSCYVVGLSIVLPMDPVVFLLYNNGLMRVGVTVAALLFGLYIQDLYSDLRVRSRLLLAQQTSLTLGLAFIVQALLSYVSRELMMPRWGMMIGSGLALVLIPGWRLSFAGVVLSGPRAERILFLGTGKLAREIEVELLDKPQHGMVVAGYVDDGTEQEAPLPDEMVLGRLEDFSEIVRTVKPDRIVVALSERRNRMPQAELLDLRFSGVQIQEVAALFELVFGRVSVRELRPSQLIFSAELGPRPGFVFFQDIYSRVVACLALVVSSPLMVLAALLVKLTSRGPILYRQTRVGLGGKPFTLYKVRSMSVDAEAKTGPALATRNDPRVTPVGRFLRRSRLDEIPQLWNVLRGEMSIVGPRPERPEFVETLVEQIPFYHQRLCVRPGITGWAQINHGYGDSIEDTITKLEYDLYYIKNLNPAIDSYVFFHTAKVILTGKGAY